MAIYNDFNSNNINLSQHVTSLSQVYVKLYVTAGLDRDLRMTSCIEVLAILSTVAARGRASLTSHHVWIFPHFAALLLTRASPFNMMCNIKKTLYETIERSWRVRNPILHCLCFLAWYVYLFMYVFQEKYSYLALGWTTRIYTLLVHNTLTGQVRDELLGAASEDRTSCLEIELSWWLIISASHVYRRHASYTLYLPLVLAHK